MPALKNILDSDGFKIGIELVSTRGTAARKRNQKTIHFGEQLCEEKDIDWISLTDNAAGHPAISSSVIARSLQNKGKEIIIHLTCKDLNRNGLESKAWELASDGLHNILALTGDLPNGGINGASKPVFDLDSVGLLYMLNKMNSGLETGIKNKPDKTHFYTGAAVSNFKIHENELLPQYLKMLKKIEMGASYIMNQAGYDALKISELRSFQRFQKLDHIHMIGNVFVLSEFSVNLFHKNKIPGVILPEKFFERCKEAMISPDKGRKFFLELAAKMMAVYKGLGYKGGYLGGVHQIEDYHTIMQIFKGYGEEDWKQFYREFQFSSPSDFFLFGRDAQGFTDPDKFNPGTLKKGVKTKNIDLKYTVSKKFHQLLFTRYKGLFNTGKNICIALNKAPKWLYGLEKIGKKVMFDCRDCGDCSLQEITYLCPESQCAKNQRNGPCGGSINGKCESSELYCIWGKAYERKKYNGNIWELLDHAPVIQNHQLRGSSSWANYWLEKDHVPHKEDPFKETEEHKITCQMPLSG